ncbi:MAG: acetate--CoA ligase family protein [Betaproteobacteria bacterium]|jgi:acyl-CoA synthetase (NDP forming)|nr:acetate--CoA ligase family protein [Betaproteobacteria bacterium]
MAKIDFEGLLAQARRDGRSSLSEPEAKQALAAMGIAVPAGEVARDAASAAAIAARLGGPFAVKVVSPDILHKSDARAVSIRLADADAVRAAIDTMAAEPAVKAARVDGWLVERMAAPGVEMVIGAVRDPQFGTMVMVGLGGVFVEVLGDVAFRLVPIARAEAESMIEALQGRALLDGARGRAPVSRAALVDLLLAVGGEGGLLHRHGDAIAELDLNPVIVSADAAVVVDARVILAPAAGARTAGAAASAPAQVDYGRLFAPKTVAVLGASATDTSIANTFIRRMKKFGYAGAIWPIHPSAPEVEGLPAFRSLADTPGPVDYAYVAIGAARVADALAAGAGRLGFAQVISSGFGEVEEGRDLERGLVDAARKGGFRVIGPNCLGLYSPRGGVTFPDDAPRETGNIGVLAQSGGLSTDIIKRGQTRGVRFSGLVTIGNSADIGAAELTGFYFGDDRTRAVGLYLESAKDGRALFDLMRSPQAKPVVLLKGGRTSQGHLAAASHTGSLAGDLRAWEALCEQTPCVMVDTVDRFVDALLALQVLELRPSRPTRRVVLFGNGGGTSVLAADCFSSVGLDILPMDDAAVEAMRGLKLPPGTGIVNPIDTPVGTLLQGGGSVAGKILDIVYASSGADALVMHLNLAAFVGRSAGDPVETLIGIAEQVGRERPGQLHFILVLRSDGSRELDDARRAYRGRALAAGIAVFDEIADAGHALAAVSQLEHRLAARGQV